MGLLKDRAHGHEEDLENDSGAAERGYEKLYVKIARDFVHKDDLEVIFNELLELLIKKVSGIDSEIDNNPIDFTQNLGALAKGEFYKRALSGKSGKRPEDFIPTDLINSKEFSNEVENGSTR